MGATAKIFCPAANGLEIAVMAEIAIRRLSKWFAPFISTISRKLASVARAGALTLGAVLAVNATARCSESGYRKAMRRSGDRTPLNVGWS
jgi:hypothetical protein